MDGGFSALPAGWKKFVGSLSEEMKSESAEVALLVATGGVSLREPSTSLPLEPLTTGSSTTSSSVGLSAIGSLTGGLSATGSLGSSSASGWADATFLALLIRRLAR